MDAKRDGGGERGRSPQCRKTARGNTGLAYTLVHGAPQQRELDPACHPRGDRQPSGPPRRGKTHLLTQWECKEIAEHDRECHADECKAKGRLRITKRIQRRRVQSSERGSKQPDRGACEDAPYPNGCLL